MNIGKHKETSEGLSIQEFTRHIDALVQSCLRDKASTPHAPLTNPGHLSGQDSLNYNSISNLKALLTPGDKETLKLDLYKSDIASTDPELMPRYHTTYDVDSVFIQITTLAVHKIGFYLSMRPSYFTQVTQNPRLLFDGHAIHKLKNMQLGFGALSGGLKIYTHI